MVVARNFMDMVAALPASKLDMLYDSAFICEAVLRSLPPLAKKYALQMLYVLAPVTAAAMEEWVLNEYAAKHRVAIDKLLQLRVFVEVRDRRKEVSYKMNQKFQGNMQKYLVDGYGFLNFCSLFDITWVILSQTWTCYDGVSNTAFLHVFSIMYINTKLRLSSDYSAL